jgi:hypothetical protein
MKNLIKSSGLVTTILLSASFVLLLLSLLFGGIGNCISNWPGAIVQIFLYAFFLGAIVLGIFIPTYTDFSKPATVLLIIGTLFTFAYNGLGSFVSLGRETNGFLITAEVFNGFAALAAIVVVIAIFLGLGLSLSKAVKPLFLISFYGLIIIAFLFLLSNFFLSIMVWSSNYPKGGVTGTYYLFSAFSEFCLYSGLAFGLATHDNKKISL